MITQTSIDKSILIRGPRSRVWRALTTPSEFGKWFGADVRGEFRPGERVDMVCTIKGYEGVRFFIIVNEMKPEATFSWHWHPGSAVPDGDSPEPMTLVEFHLTEAEGGTLLPVSESGFDAISLAKRAKAYEENVQGWDHQLQSIKTYVEGQ